jgi:hypothetical protein
VKIYGDKNTFSKKIETPSITLNGTDLQTTLDGKAATSHTHTISQISDWTSSMSSGATRDLYFGQALTNNNSLRLRYYWEANNSSKNRICIGFPNNGTDNSPIHIDNSRVQINTNLVCDNISSEAGGTNLQDQINAKVNTSDLLNLIYPVGSVYMSFNYVSPSTFLGGTWVLLQGRFLLGACTTDYTNEVNDFGNMMFINHTGYTGGTTTHALTLAEIPSHSHFYDKPTHKNGYPDGSADTGGGSTNSSYWKGMSSSTTNNGSTDYAGGVSAHNNMPPYITVYMWRRTA